MLNGFHLKHLSTKEIAPMQSVDSDCGLSIVSHTLFLGIHNAFQLFKFNSEMFLRAQMEIHSYTMHSIDRKKSSGEYFNV